MQERRDREMDKGRPVVVLLFGLLMIGQVRGLVAQIDGIGPDRAMPFAALLHRLLVICFYGLFLLFYLLRRPARSTTDSFAARCVAIVATFLPFALPALGRPLPVPLALFLGDLVAIAGMILTICSLGALGRSLSIIPQARTLVRTGPYRLVRHPVYLGELIALFGIVLAQYTPSAAGLFCLLAAAQVYRALQEEKLLTAAFPEYAHWSAARARFLPGIF